MFVRCPERFKAKCTPTQLGLTVSVLAETKRDASRTEVDTKREKKKN